MNKRTPKHTITPSVYFRRSQTVTRSETKRFCRGQISDLLRPKARKQENRRKERVKVRRRSLLDGCSHMFDWLTNLLVLEEFCLICFLFCLYVLLSPAVGSCMFHVQRNPPWPLCPTGKLDIVIYSLLAAH